MGDQADDNHLKVWDTEVKRICQSKPTESHWTSIKNILGGVNARLMGINLREMCKNITGWCPGPKTVLLHDCPFKDKGNKPVF